ncbi:MAG: putative zinc-binding protein [Bacillota bacterium]|jgi:uncharacterized metal-binding protein
MPSKAPQAQPASHEAALLVCFGGLSNTGYITALAAMEAVKRVGLRKAAIFCLAGVPAGVKSVTERLRATDKVMTIDGCPNNCALKVAEAAGLPVFRSLTLTTDLGLRKVAFAQHLAQDPKDPMDFIDPSDIERSVEAILAAVNEGHPTGE